MWNFHLRSHTKIIFLLKSRTQIFDFIAKWFSLLNLDICKRLLVDLTSHDDTGAEEVVFTSFLWQPVGGGAGGGDQAGGGGHRDRAQRVQGAQEVTHHIPQASMWVHPRYISTRHSNTQRKCLLRSVCRNVPWYGNTFQRFLFFFFIVVCVHLEAKICYNEK